MFAGSSTPRADANTDAKTNTNAKPKPASSNGNNSMTKAKALMTPTLQPPPNQKQPQQQQNQPQQQHKQPQQQQHKQPQPQQQQKQPQQQQKKQPQQQQEKQPQQQQKKQPQQQQQQQKKSQQLPNQPKQPQNQPPQQQMNQKHKTLQQQQQARQQHVPVSRIKTKNTRDRRHLPAKLQAYDSLVVDVLNFLQQCDWRQPPAQMFRQLMELMQRPDALTFRMLEAVRHDLSHVLHARFGNDTWRIHPFGSAISTLSFRDSDFDILVHMPPCTFTNKDKAKHQLIGRIQSLANLMRAQNNFGQVIAITSARVPIIKSWHFGTNTACDFSFCYNFFSVHNTFVVRHLVNCNARIKPLTLLLKFWFRRHDYLGTGKFTSYCLFQMIVFYLQQLPEPMLPALQYMQRDTPPHLVDGWNVAFDFEKELPATRNTDSLMELLVGFFAFYRQMDFERVVICTLTAQTYPRDAFSANAAGQRYKDQALYTLAVQADLCTPLNVIRPLCVQDPFTLNINVGSVSNVVFGQFQMHLHLLELEEAAPPPLLPPSALPTASPTAAVADTLLRLCRPHPAMMGKIKYDQIELIPTAGELAICARKLLLLEPGTLSMGDNARTKAALTTVWKACAMRFMRMFLVEVTGARLDELPSVAAQLILKRIMLGNKAEKRLKKKAKAAANLAAKKSADSGPKSDTTPEPKATTPDEQKQKQQQGTPTPTKRDSSGDAIREKSGPIEPELSTTVAEAILDKSDPIETELSTTVAEAILDKSDPIETELSTAAAEHVGDNDDNDDDDDDDDNADDDDDVDDEYEDDDGADSEDVARDVVAADAADEKAAVAAIAGADNTTKTTETTQTYKVFVKNNVVQYFPLVKIETLMELRSYKQRFAEKTDLSTCVHYNLGLCNDAHRDGLMLVFQYNQYGESPANRTVAKTVAGEQQQQAAVAAFANTQQIRFVLHFMRKSIRNSLGIYFKALDLDEVQVTLSDEIVGAVRANLTGKAGR